MEGGEKTCPHPTSPSHVPHLIYLPSHSQAMNLVSSLPLPWEAMVGAGGGEHLTQDFQIMNCEISLIGWQPTWFKNEI